MSGAKVHVQRERESFVVDMDIERVDGKRLGVDRFLLAYF